MSVAFGLLFVAFLVTGFYAYQHTDFVWCKYEIHLEQQKWGNAIEVCRQRGKTLVVIDNEIEHKYLTSLIKESVALMIDKDRYRLEQLFWIGLHIDGHGNTNWANCGTYSFQSEYMSYNPLGNVNNAGCFLIDTNNLLFSHQDCDETQMFICEAEKLDTNACFKPTSLLQGKRVPYDVATNSCENRCSGYCFAFASSDNNICGMYSMAQGNERPRNYFIKELLQTTFSQQIEGSINPLEHCELSLTDHLPTIEVTSEPIYSSPRDEDVHSTSDIINLPTVEVTSELIYSSPRNEGLHSTFDITSLKALPATAVSTESINTSPPVDVNGPFLTYRTNHSKIPLMTRLTINVTCNNCADPSYKWTVQKRLNSTYVNITHFGIQNRSSLHISTTSMKPGENWNFHIDVKPLKNQGKLSKSISMFVNELPYNGDCDISLRTEESKFTLKCSSWKDEGGRSQRNPHSDTDTGVIYEVFLTDETEKIITPPIITDAVSQASTFTLPAGYVNDYSNCNITLVVRVKDMQGDYVSSSASFRTYDLRSNMTMQILCEIEINATMEILKRGTELLAKWNSLKLENTTMTYTVPMRPKQWANGVPDVIDCNNTYSYNQLLENVFQEASDENLDSVTVAIEQISEAMLTSLKQFNVKTMENIWTAADTFAIVVNDSIRVTDTSTKNVADAYAILCNIFLNMTDIGSTTSVQTVFSLISLESALVNVISPDNLSDMYEVLITIDTKDSRKYVDFMASVYKDKAYNLIECSQITPEERTGIFKLFANVIRLHFKQRQLLANECIDQVLANHKEVLLTFATKICFGCNYTFDAELVHSMIIKNSPSAISGNPVSIADLGLTTYITDEEVQEILVFVDVFDKNPYIQGESITSSVITSKILNVRLVDKSNRAHISLVQATFPVTNEISGTFYPVFTPDDASKCIYHILMYRSVGDHICLKINALQITEVTAYEVYVRRGHYPTHLRFDYSSKILQTNNWTSCLRPEFDSGIVYLCLRPILSSGDTQSWQQHKREKRSTRSTSAALTPYNLTIATGSCEVWDRVKKTWRSENKKCSMIWRASEDQLQCKCYDVDKELIIGNSFYVPANTISFSTVFLKFSPYNQASVLSVLTVTVVLYVTLCVWARYQDRKDVVKWGVTPLVDNSMDDTYYYLITVYTGMRFGAGTKTPVEFQLVGSRKETGVRKLFDGVRKEFKRGSAMNFVMTTGHPLGDLDYIHMWLNPDDGHPIQPWYLNRIDVEDLQQKRRYIFGCNKWLPDDSQSRCLEVLMPVYGKEDVLTFRNMFYYNIFENFAENHVFVSIFNRPTCSNFTRVQRVTCFFVFVTMTMISNAIYFTPDDKYEDPEQLKLGPLILSLQAVYVSLISGAISAGTSFLVSTLFRKSKPRCLEKKRESQSKRRSIFERFFRETQELEKILISKGMIYTDGMIFPFWFIYIAWLLSVCGSVTSCFFLVLFSMEWGKQQSEMWLTQFFMSFGETTVILDQIKIPIIAAIFAMAFIHIRTFRPSPFSRLLILNNYKQRFMEQNDHKDRKPGPLLNIDARKKNLTELNNKLNFVHSVKDLVFTCLFIWIVTIISYGNRDDNSYLIHNNIRNYLVTPSDKIHFDKIRKTADLNTWLTETAFTAIFPDMGNYNETLHWRWRQYFSDFYNFRVGPPRLRQLRTEKEVDVYPFIGRIKHYGNYDIKEEATEDYCVGWQSSPCDLEKETYSFSSRAWKYTSALDIWGMPVAGIYTLYGGGGYIAELDVNRDMSQRIMTELTKNRWIDRHSRAVFLEFTLYSPTVNIFTHATFLFELPETGGIITKYTLYPFRIYQHHGRNGVLMVVSEVIFVVAVVVLLVKVTSDIYKQRCSFFKSVLKFLDFIILLTCLSCIGLYTARFLMAAETMSKFNKQPKDYLNFQHLLVVDFLFVFVLTNLQALVTARFMANLKFVRSVEKLFHVLVKCLRDLGWFSILFWYIIVGYACLGNQLFGRNLHSYMSLINALNTLTITILGKSNFKQIESTNKILSKFYFLFFIIMQVYFLLTIFFALLSEGIDAAQKMRSYQSDKLIYSFKMSLKRIFKRKEITEKDKPSLQVTIIPLIKELRHCCHKEFQKIRKLSRRVKYKGLTRNPPKTKQSKLMGCNNKHVSKMGSECV